GWSRANERRGSCAGKDLLQRETIEAGVHAPQYAAIVIDACYYEFTTKARLVGVDHQRTIGIMHTKGFAAFVHAHEGGVEEGRSAQRSRVDDPLSACDHLGFNF